MIAALVFAAGATVLFIVFAWFFGMEKKHSRRFAAAKSRNILDVVLLHIITWLNKKAVYIGRYVITLSWYYSLHTFLKLILQFLAGVYTVIEAILHRNRDRARVIRTERKRAAHSHLTVLAEHKIETKLTDSQKKKRNDEALRGK